MTWPFIDWQDAPAGPPERRQGSGPGPWSRPASRCLPTPATAAPAILSRGPTRGVACQSENVTPKQLGRVSQRHGLGLWLADVDQPRDAELVDAHAELIAPGLLLQRHRGRPAGGQLRPVVAQGVVVVAEAHRETGHGLIFHLAGYVGAHDRVTGVRLEHPMHDPIGVGRILGAELSEGAEAEVASEHAGVELQCLAGVAVEVEVRTQPRGHDLLLRPCAVTGHSGDPPASAGRS